MKTRAVVAMATAKVCRRVGRRPRLPPRASRPGIERRATFAREESRHALNDAGRVVRQAGRLPYPALASLDGSRHR